VKAIPTSTRVMAPLGNVLHRGIVVEPRENTQGAGMVCVEFTPPVTIEPTGSIFYITCPQAMSQSDGTRMDAPEMSDPGGPA
jgi:hypothetical protein